MKILFIGDIVAKPGRQTIKEILPKVIKKYGVDFVIANAENLSHGNGFSPDTISEMQKAGVDFFTSGDHVWGNHSGVLALEDPNFPVIRPENFPPAKIPGRGHAVIQAKNGEKILVINLIGRVFMKKHYECPFRTVDEILKKYSDEKFAAIIVDVHAEATSEKYALGFYLDGRVSAVVGTHTHVPTADWRILDNSTAFMADVGMTGSLDSVIGVKKEIIIKSFLSQMPIKHEPETSGKMVFNGCLIELDEKSGKAIKVEHIQQLI